MDSSSSIIIFVNLIIGTGIGKSNSISPRIYSELEFINQMQTPKLRGGPGFLFLRLVASRENRISGENKAMCFLLYL
jgi:hypothetical protein